MKIEKKKWKLKKRNTKHETRDSTIENRKWKLPSRAWPRPSREADVHSGHDTTLQRRPPRIADRVPTERNDRIGEPRWIGCAVERLRINSVAAPCCQTVELIGTIKLRGAWRRAAPPTECCSHGCTARRIDSDNMRGENSCYARR